MVGGGRGCPILSHAANITLILNPDKDIFKKAEALMNTDRKNLNKMLPFQTQKYKKGQYTVTKWGLSQDYNIHLIFAN